MTQQSLALVPRETLATEYPVLLMTNEQLSEETNGLVEAGMITAFDLDEVKVPAGGNTYWMIPSENGEVPSANYDGILLHIQRRRAYWQNEFGAGGAAGTPPDCKSDNGITGEGVPGGACSKCPLAEFGTDKNGSGAACRESMTLFFLRPGARFPERLRVPRSSLKAVKKYLLGFAKWGIKPWDVVTRATLVKAQSQGGIPYGQVVLASTARLSPEDAASAKAKAVYFADVFNRTEAAEPDIHEDAAIEADADYVDEGTAA